MRTLAHTNVYTDAGGQLIERQFRLVVLAGPDVGLRRPIETGTTMIGTHVDNDVVLSDATVSRYHLELQVRRDGLAIKDLDSTNGTRHEGARVGAITLTGPARLRLGKHTELAIETDDAPAPLGEWSGDRFGGVIGSSPPMRKLFALLARVAPTDATVLLEGETGTGKEAIAEALHQASARATGPFIVVDCASIPRELIASELFGHAKGSYTGAISDKRGLIEAAHGGTLFLDEIGELPLDLQPQLLRALEKREVRRVGETKPIAVDIRVLAATHRDLRTMVKAGAFREDLFYRLAVVRCDVPPLRARPGDLPTLARYFAESFGRSPWELSPTLLADLARHDWPGNVRELRNVVERALSLGTLAVDDDLPAAPPVAAGTAAASASHDGILELPFKEAKAALVEGFERDYLVHLLARHRGNISRAAHEAGIDRNYIHRLVKKYGLDVERG
ncbi:MAG: sigma 54-dependent Fis family transcriptional regulator [Myxococcales bacterium]|nr:sigma 54-dependent Fis family transcriptional regulator [Myxococcales bacterium]